MSLMTPPAEMLASTAGDLQGVGVAVVPREAGRSRDGT